jgi:hypothetical protein
MALSYEINSSVQRKIKIKWYLCQISAYAKRTELGNKRGCCFQSTSIIVLLYFIEKRTKTMSLITMSRRIIDPNNDAPAKYKQKPTFGEKKLFFTSPVGKGTKDL